MFCIKAVVEAVVCLKEAVPQVKIVISKLLPVGSSVLNAQNEKKLLADHNYVIFINHSNLTEQEEIIKEYYRQDQLHLSSRGIFVFGGSLHRAIT